MDQPDKIISRPKREPALWLVMLASALLGVLLFSQSTSPLYDSYGYDSAMFQTIGKYWLRGDLPYVDLFDHKGPMIFFINALGYIPSLWGGRDLIFLIQALSLAVSEHYAYRLLRLRLPKLPALAAALLMPLILLPNWQEGNTTEEYVLPLLFASYYHLFSAAPGPYGLPARYAALYGAGFGFALMTRVTNALGLCLAVGLVAIGMAVKGRWLELGKNALAFMLGAMVPVLPFCLYFYAQGALYDMWYGTILYNLDYMASSSSASVQGLVDLLSRIRLYLTGWCLAAAGALCAILDKGRRGQGLFWMTVALISTAFLYTLNSYAHYGTVLLPFFYIALALLWDKRIFALLMSLVVLASSCLKAYRFFTVKLPPSAYEDIIDYGDDYLALTELIPDQGRDSFIAFNCPRALYLQADLRPAFPYFVLQQWMLGNSGGLDIYDSFLEARVEWVLSFEPEGADQDISALLRENYSLVAQSEHGAYKLYHLE